MMKVVTIIGARPQFIKAAPVSHELRKNAVEVLVHTGQHYDDSMSDIFFRELEIPEPDYNLNVGSGTHGMQTSQMLTGIEKVLIGESPDRLLIYGDTNSTLAGALAAAKLHIRVAHVEAGLRSYNRLMPEEINRVMADHLSDVLFCPSQTAVDNLKKEGITRGVHLVGDVMADSVELAGKMASDHSQILSRLGLAERQYILATIHRPENTDSPSCLLNILNAFNKIETKIIFPVHPRTKKAILKTDWTPSSQISLIEPVGYMDMISLEKSARYTIFLRCRLYRRKGEWWAETTGPQGSGILSSMVKADGIMIFPENQERIEKGGATSRPCLPAA